MTPLSPKLVSTQPRAGHCNITAVVEAGLRRHFEATACQPIVAHGHHKRAALDRLLSGNEQPARVGLQVECLDQAHDSVPAPDLKASLLSGAERLSQWLLSNSSAAAGNIAAFGFGFFVMVMGLFYFLRDGDQLVRWIVGLFPTTKEQKHDLLEKLGNVVASSVTSGADDCGNRTGSDRDAAGGPRPAGCGRIGRRTYSCAVSV